MTVDPHQSTYHISELVAHLMKSASETTSGYLDLEHYITNETTLKLVPSHQTVTGVVRVQKLLFQISSQVSDWVNGKVIGLTLT